MNFFEGRLVRQGDGAAVVQIGPGAEARSLALAGTPLAHLAGQATADGRAVVVGVRPEDLHTAPDGAPDSLAGTVDVVEHLGNEQLVYLQVPGVLKRAAVGAAQDGEGPASAATARVAPSERLRMGDRVTLAVDLAHVHLFDPDTTNRFV
jgi:multiple sugar transport system ATP-binding protein